MSTSDLCLTSSILCNKSSYLTEDKLKTMSSIELSEQLRIYKENEEKYKYTSMRLSHEMFRSYVDMIQAEIDRREKEII